MSLYGVHVCETNRPEGEKALKRAFTTWCVVACCIMVLTLLGRTVPELDAEVFFTEMGLRFFSG